MLACLLALAVATEENKKAAEKDDQNTSEHHLFPFYSYPRYPLPYPHPFAGGFNPPYLFGRRRRSTDNIANTGELETAEGRHFGYRYPQYYGYGGFGGYPRFYGGYNSPYLFNGFRFGRSVDAVAEDNIQ